MQEPPESVRNEINAAFDATATSVILAPGPLPKGPNPDVHGARRVVMYWGSIAGVGRIVGLDDDGAIFELTRARLASASMTSQFLSSDAIVEVAAKLEGPDDGYREYIILAGPKKALKKAFDSIGYSL